MKIERDNHLQTARELEERRLYLERILAAAPDAIVTLDAAHKVVEWNRGAERLFQYSRDEARGHDLDDLLTTPDLFTEAARFTKTALSGREVGPVETVRYRKDGSPVHVILAGSPILIQDELIGLVAVYTDISGRVHAEKEILRQNRDITTLYEAATVISSDLSLNAVLRAVAEQVAGALDANGCRVSVLHRERDQLEMVVDYHTDRLDGKRKVGAVYKLSDYPVVRKVLQNGQPAVINKDDPRADAQELALMAEQGMYSLLMLPLIARDRVLGLIEVVSETEQRRYKVAEIRLAESLAAQAAISIENARLYELAQHEITERMRAEEALKDYSERLEEMVLERTQALRDAQEKLVRQEKLAALGQLAGGLGHELRTPVGAIKAAVYFLNLVLETTDPDVKETLDILEREADASERIINSLLDFARTKAPTRTEIDVNESVREALARISVPPSIQVELHLPEELPLIQADQDQLVHVFANLMLNAVQAMTAPSLTNIATGDKLTVKSGIGDRSDCIVVTISDTGVGIPEDLRVKIFEPLFTTKPKGIGLGLAVGSSLVKAHGGTLEVTSEEGIGSTFAVTLPTDGGLN